MEYIKWITKLLKMKFKTFKVIMVNTFIRVNKEVYLYLFIYLLDIHHIPPPRGRHATMPRKEAKGKEGRKNGSGQRAKPSIPTQGIDARMGEEEKNRT